MRNQVDCIITTTEYKKFVTKSNSYGGKFKIQTEIVHTLVLILNGARAKQDRMHTNIKSTSQVAMLTQNNKIQNKIKNKIQQLDELPSG